MEVTVSHAPSGEICVIGVADTDTVHDLKARALEAIFAGPHADTGGEAAGVAARTSGAVISDLHDTDRIADTPLEGGDHVQLVRRWVELKAPAEYHTHDPLAPSDCLTAVALSPSDLLCALGTSGGHVFVFDTNTAERVARVSGGPVLCVAFSRCGAWLAACSTDSSIQVWCTAAWECLHRLEGHTDSVCSAAWVHSGRLVSASEDYTMRVWDVVRGVCTAEVQGYARPVRAVVASHSRFFAAADDSVIRVWDADDLSRTDTLSGHTGYVRHLALTSDGRHLVSCSYDTTVKVWCTVDLLCLRTLQVGPVSPSTVAVSQAGGVVAAAYEGCTELWGLDTGAHIGSAAAPRCSTAAVALSLCGRWLLASHRDGVCVSAVRDVEPTPWQHDAKSSSCALS